MDYYKKELWEMINSSNQSEQKEAEQMWNENVKNYSLYFNNIKKKLPKNFIIPYTKYSNFHDFMIENICIKSTDDNLSEITVLLNYENISYNITYSKVIQYRINVPENHQWFGGKMMWGYDEFKIYDTKYFTHKILCNMNCEIEIMFKRIKAEKQKQGVF